MYFTLKLELNLNKLSYLILHNYNISLIYAISFCFGVLDMKIEGICCEWKIDSERSYFYAFLTTKHVDEIKSWMKYFRSNGSFRSQIISVSFAFLQLIVQLNSMK